MRTARLVIGVAQMFLMIFVGSCSGGGSKVVIPDGGVDAIDAAASGTSCQSIRVCVGGVASAADAQRCVDMGTTEAQQTYLALRSCLTSPPASCSSDFDTTCICQEECYADGYCLAEVNACLGATTTDLFCNGPCAP
jgi:hypothetical protein